MEVGKAGEMQTAGDCAGGDGCTMQHVHDVLLSCTLEPYVVLQTNITPVNSIKNKINKNDCMVREKK